MGILNTLVRIGLWLGPLLAGLLAAGCAGMDPYEHRDYREEGSEKGLFSGDDGEFVIFRRPNRPDADGETVKKKADE